jgi:hypothetical protein
MSDFVYRNVSQCKKEVIIFMNAPLTKMKLPQYNNLKRTQPPYRTEENMDFPSRIGAERGLGMIWRDMIDIRRPMGYCWP